jgi:LysM repeat protein
MYYRFLLLVIVFALGLTTITAQDVTEEPGITEEAPTEEEPTVEPATEEPTGEATPAPTLEGNVYIVRAGDTLFRIAVRFNTTVSALALENGITNPNLIYTGQRLRIPGATSGTATTIPTTAATVAPTPEDGETINYTVRSGDTLFTIALRHRTTVARLVELNTIQNRNVIYTGQILKVPVGDMTVPPTATRVTVTQTATPATGTIEVTEPTPTDDLGALDDPGFAYGIVAFADASNAPLVSEQAVVLGMEWVKVNVRWRDFEPEQGQIDFSGLDAVVDALDNEGLTIE